MKENNAVVTGSHHNHVGNHKYTAECQLTEPMSSSNEEGTSIPIKMPPVDAPMRNGQLVKVFSLVFLTFQNAGTALLLRYARTRPNVKLFQTTTAVLMCELIKFVASFAIGSVNEGGVRRFLDHLHNVIIVKPGDTLRMTIPSLVYLLQNNAGYIAISNLELTTYMVTYEVRILTTAIFSVLVLGRSPTRGQWVALLILFAGVAFVQFSRVDSKPPTKIVVPTIEPDIYRGRLEDRNGSTRLQLHKNLKRDVQNSTIASDHINQEKFQRVQRPWLGLAALLLAATCSGFGSVFMEKMLESCEEASVWTRNIQLALIAIPVSLITVIWEAERSGDPEGIFVGFDHIAWGCTLSLAIGGLMVAFVIKIAGNLLKLFATSLAIVLAAVCSVYMFDTQLSEAFALGTGMVLASMWLYFRYKT